MNVCAHCGKRFRVGGSLFRAGVDYPLCHPDEGLDCYHLVTVYGEEIGSRKQGRRTKVDHKKYLSDHTQRDHVRELLALLQDGEPVTLKLSDAEVEQVKRMMEDLKDG